jgi:hypothetical protein
MGDKEINLYAKKIIHHHNLTFKAPFQNNGIIEE